MATLSTGIWTYDNSLFWPQKLNDRQARWSLYLSEFNIKLIHLPGTQMVQSNTLSRRPDHGIDESTGREEQTLLPVDMFINLIDIDLQEWILNSSDKTTDIKTTLETIMKEGPTNLQNNLANWKIEDVDGRKEDYLLQRKELHFKWSRITMGYNQNVSQSWNS